VYRVSRDAVRSFSKLLETLTLVRVTYAHVGARVAGWVGEEEKHTYCCYAYRLYFLTCDMYKSSLRHIHDPVLSSLKMEGMLSFYCIEVVSFTTRPLHPFRYEACVFNSSWGQIIVKELLCICVVTRFLTNLIGNAWNTKG
jgi:hypothetical protein